ncbi:MAG: EF-P beta-lysylation protein EpmB [Pirellulaceae bacterium]
MSGILHPTDPSVEGSFSTGEESPPRWPQALKRSVRSGFELCELLGIAPNDVSEEAESDFPVFVPREYIERIEPGNPSDPLLRQVVSSQLELSPEGLVDPVGDAQSEATSGLLHKYKGRVLLIVSGACAVHCRYCFRRNYPYSSAPNGPGEWSQWVDYLRNDESIEEVILSGGDPLSVRDESLAWLVSQFESISHLKRLRIHTRFPVVIPQRVCEEMTNWLSTTRLAKFVVLHINHAQEIDDAVAAAARRLREGGATVLNQAVLLRGVNDSWLAQRNLSNALIAEQILPYYLHQLDPVRGGRHFEVSDSEAEEIFSKLRQELPGYAVPKLVRELAGEPSKTRLL